MLSQLFRKYAFSRHILSHHSNDVDDDKIETTCSMTSNSSEGFSSESTPTLPEPAKSSNDLDVMELASGSFVCSKSGFFEE